ncbi:PP0621 family protein [Pseudothauera rhizosphaerae]|uniref:Preprotein translocase subunit YajC n=1 Tax=Pseudothauera rhizosphaerae TaxID=2565932 RepID=A0A4S4AB72_9RHOO|nr:PP0621 family protein [Pseudothauera rhizosphaerae]THF56175.1 hypothetical protein E6O51_19430 [Pseudothauera rhizosphaerae]
MRNLLLFILVVIVVWWARRALQKLRAPGRGNGPAREQVPERMLACDHCGVLVPESEGVREGDAFFCSEAHRQLGARRP